MPFKPFASEAFREAEGRYNEALQRLQAAVRAAESPETLQACRRELELQKRSMRAAAKRPEGWAEKPEWRAYPPPAAVPRCRHDPRFARSFDVADVSEARAFFEEYGFVVFRDVLDGPQCEATAAEIWDFLEKLHPGLRRDDANTWEELSSERYGLPEAQAIFTPQVMRNREAPGVYAALDAVLPPAEARADWDSPHPSPNSVVVSQDRWCIYRPAAENPSWKTAENLHLDVNPWTYMGEEPSYKDCMRYGMDGADPMADDRLPLRDFRAEITSVQGCAGVHVQGVLNLLDNLEEDGGTRVVPGFHKAFPEWFKALGPLEQNLFQSGPHDNFVLRRAHGGGSFKFSNLDPIHKLSHRVPMRAGSMLIWNQLVVHGSVANNSSNFRMAQFITGFRAAELSPARAWARRAAVLQQVAANGLRLGPLAPHVFGACQDDVDRRG